MIIFPSKTLIKFPRYAIGTIFNAICVLGIVAGIFPLKCSKITSMQTKGLDLKLSNKDYKGHHPNCEKYYTHIVKFGENHLCTGCTGLIIGGIIALSGSILYFYFNYPYIYDETSLSLGLILVILGLIQHKIDFDNPFLHIVLNIGFVVGSFLLLASLDYLYVNTFYGLYLLGMIIFWINTRIKLSQYDHYLICKSCDVSCTLTLNGQLSQ